MGTYPGSSGGALAVKEFEEGTLLFDLSERKSGKLVYRGSAKATLLDDPSPTRSDIRLSQIVSQLLSGVPRREGQKQKPGRLAPALVCELGRAGSWRLRHGRMAQNRRFRPAWTKGPPSMSLSWILEPLRFSMVISRAKE